MVPTHHLGFFPQEPRFPPKREKITPQLFVPPFQHLYIQEGRPTPFGRYISKRPPKKMGALTIWKETPLNLDPKGKLFEGN